MIIIFPFWLIFGILFGLYAAKRNGLDVAKAAIYGLLLGPLAFLMLGASDNTRRQCPACTEWVKRAALVCKHCGSDISPRAMVQARRAAMEAAEKSRTTPRKEAIRLPQSLH